MGWKLHQANLIGLWWTYIVISLAVTDIADRASSWLYAALERLHDLIYDKDIEPAELFAGGGAITWGLILLAPAKTFTTSPTFTNMAYIADENWWGAVLFSIGFCVVAGMWFSYWFDTWQIRRQATFVCFFLWSFVCILFAISNFWSTATGIYPWFAFASGWAHLRLKRLKRYRGG